MFLVVTLIGVATITFFLSRVLPGSPVTLVIDSRAEEPIRAEVTRRAAALDVTTRTMRVEVELDNASGRLLPGMFCHALIEVAQREDAMTLPGATIRTAGKQDFVFVVEGGRVARRDVQLGMDNGILVEVASGLSGDEQVVVGQVAGLQEGDAVEVQEK
jgi:RND family efflux transporter MFP subunit